ncbi:photosystem II stability/assembly factor-like protein [Flavobacterium magnum]|uniref:Photosystem II stability/assembly factor-like protein n=1 Tax=Flavobacterium magnum TaxID=2162713 RepID=A0A2S0RE01_9FLAO|nr:T9SS type A sorting domain-containing protein [Flavobacterium magnum]AWA29845.1 photosystem II stability/assembly factor-like protein [Flavobacterium magnum]
MKKYYFLLLFTSALVSAQLQWAPFTNVYENEGFQRYDDVFFLNENTGWAANGYFSKVYKTTDGGANWQLQLELEPGNEYFRNIEFLNENIGFVGTLSSTFLKTVDGGATWAPVTNLPTTIPAICGLSAVGGTTIYGCGAYFSPAYIIKSVDSGDNWQFIDMSAYANALVEILFIDENTGFVSGKDDNGGVILKTVDGGANWTPLYHSGIPGEYVWKLQDLHGDGQILFGSVESVSPLLGKLVRSTDGGANWVSKEVPDTDIQAVGFVSETHGWMGGHATGLLETTDGGDIWTDTGVGSNMNRIVVVNDHLAYASGTTVYKLTDQNLSVPFTESPRKPLAASISPNPVREKLNLSVAFIGSDHLVIELYDSAGKLIRQLKRDTIEGASVRNYSFDFPYAAGVYVVNLHSNTGRQSIKFVKSASF